MSTSPFAYSNNSDTPAPSPTTAAPLSTYPPLPIPRSYPMEKLPSSSEILSARFDLQSDSLALEALHSLEENAFAELESKRHEIKRRCKRIHEQREIIHKNSERALSFIAPIRRLPLEVYRLIFLSAVHSDPDGRTVWLISGVCRLWRKMVLSMPDAWAMIKWSGWLTGAGSGLGAELIRIWVERSGASVDLDIDIELTRRRRTPRAVDDRTSGAVRRGWNVTRRIRHPHRPHPYSINNDILPSLDRRDGFINTVSPSGDIIESAENIHRLATQWGHIVMFYLMTQKSRWKRFVFESLEVSVEGLGNLNGPFPRLQEFSIRSGETSCRPTIWQWFLSYPHPSHHHHAYPPGPPGMFYHTILPNGAPYTLSQSFPLNPPAPNIVPQPASYSPSAPKPGQTPTLKRLTLSHCNFSWSSPIFQSLTHLTINSPSPMIYASHSVGLDTLVPLLHANPSLVQLELSLPSLQGSMLPSVENLELNELKVLALEGAPAFVGLLERLTVRSVEKVVVKFDTPQGGDFNRAFGGMLERSGYPKIKSFAVQQPYRTQETNLSYLFSMPDLEELSIARLPMEDALVFLSTRNGDDNNGVVAGGEGLPCPSLKRLNLMNCPGRRDLESLVPRLVQFVELRTQDGMTQGVIKEQLDNMEIVSCGITIGVQQVDWIRKRLGRFEVCEGWGASW